MKVLAILAAYNEERFLAGLIEHLRAHGVGVHLIDNGSTDATGRIARGYLGNGVVAIEDFPRDGSYRWDSILARKAALASSADADWVMHVDADEIHLPPSGRGTLAEAFQRAEDEGYNAVNFQEFTFLPTAEEPDHDHPRFRETMRRYYPFCPFSPHLVRAWKRQPEPVSLAESGGHQVSFPEQRIYPERFPMLHYLLLGARHLTEKYAERRYDPSEVARGWHGWRARVRPGLLRLPPDSELRPFTSVEELDASSPRLRHYLDELYGVPPPDVTS